MPRGRVPHARVTRPAPGQLRLDLLTVVDRAGGELLGHAQPIADRGQFACNVARLLVGETRGGRGVLKLAAYLRASAPAARAVACSASARWRSVSAAEASAVCSAAVAARSAWRRAVSAPAERGECLVSLTRRGRGAFARRPGVVRRAVRLDAGASGGGLGLSPGLLGFGDLLARLFTHAVERAWVADLRDGAGELSGERSERAGEGVAAGDHVVQQQRPVQELGALASEHPVRGLALGALVIAAAFLVGGARVVALPVAVDTRRDGGRSQPG
jgi:hypothetical protein